jgi:hypothetical protein
VLALRELVGAPQRDVGAVDRRLGGHLHVGGAGKEQVADRVDSSWHQYARRAEVVVVEGAVVGGDLQALAVEDADEARTPAALEQIQSAVGVADVGPIAAVLDGEAAGVVLVGDHPGTPKAGWQRDGTTERLR